MDNSKFQQIVIDFMDEYPVECETDFNMFAVDFVEAFSLICQDIADDKGWEFEGI